MAVEYSEDSRITKISIPPETITYYLGGIDFVDNAKILYDITEFVNQKETQIESNSEDGINKIENIKVYFPVDTTNSGADYLVNTVKKLSLLPFIITKGSEVVFNGLVKSSPITFDKGINPKYVEYDLTIAHISYQLKTNPIDFRTNQVGIKVQTYLNMILESSDLTKYKTTNEVL